MRLLLLDDTLQVPFIFLPLVSMCPRNRQFQTTVSKMNPIATERSEDNPNSLDINLVCMYKKSSSNCPALVERVTSRIQGKVSTMEPTFSKYANFPSCSGR